MVGASSAAPVHASTMLNDVMPANPFTPFSSRSAYGDRVSCAGELVANGTQVMCGLRRDQSRTVDVAAVGSSSMCRLSVRSCSR